MNTKAKILLFLVGLAVVFPVLFFKHFKYVLNTPMLERPDKPKEEAKPYKHAITTLFWIGESSNESNGFISNYESYWDSFWLDHYGGIDSPDKRCGYYPCGFTPKENPFYFALPYGDRNKEGDLKESVKLIPWYYSTPLTASQPASENESLLKNHWIEIKYGDKICYAQWEDVGPFETDDFDYVFGEADSKNTFGVSAGLDISPAVWDCLSLKDNSVAEWIFVEEKDVPAGPWKSIITRSGISF